MWFQWMVELGLDRKLKELRKGWDKDGKIHPLAPRTIKYRRSEVGPVHKRAPRGIPALDLSRVMSLLTGRAHLTSAEFWWGFDSVTGESFARILHFWANDQAHDVFGLSPAGTAWVQSEALKKWAVWKAANPRAGLANVPGARAVPKIAVRRPVRTVPIPGRTDLENMDLAGGEAEIRAAMAAGRFPGFRRLNMRGEQWKPGPGIPVGQLPPKPPAAAMPAVRKPPSKLPAAKPYHLETAGPVPPDLVAHHERAIQEIPAPVLRALKSGGVKFVYANTLVDRAPDLAGKSPPGWPEGMTWEHSEGAYRWRVKEIIVARKHRSYDLSNPVQETSQRQRAVLYHETGHSLDDALGHASSKQDWRDAWTRDTAALNVEDRTKLAYVLQRGLHGPAETFAELHANELGENTVGMDMRPHFPECLKLLRAIVKALP